MQEAELQHIEIGGTYLPIAVGVYPIQIPGRENRITEKALTDMCKLNYYTKQLSDNYLCSLVVV